MLLPTDVLEILCPAVNEKKKKKTKPMGNMNTCMAVKQQQLVGKFSVHSLLLHNLD